MEYANLGQNCGLKVSKVILGAMSYGSSDWIEWVKNEEDVLPLLKAAYDMGINTWDTADMYSNGMSEKLISKAIKEYNIPRERLVILSKVYFGFDEEDMSKRAVRTNDGPWVNRCGLSRKHILDAVDGSIARLGTYIDVLQIHRLDSETPKEEIMRALHDVVQSGKVRYIGASSMAAWEFQMLQSIAEKNGWTKFVSMQNYYNLLYREEEREMIPFCKATGVGLIPWSPLARGVLARPFTNRDTTREKSDGYLHYLIRSRETASDERIVDTVQQIANQRGVAMAVVAIAWMLKKGTLPIVGLSSVERMKDAVAAVKFELSDDEIKSLEQPYVPRHVVGF